MEHPAAPAHRHNSKGKNAKFDKLFHAAKVAKQSSGVKAVVTPAVSSSHPFEVDAKDHAETPFEAYRDIEPLLFRIAQDVKKTKDKLVIYDPFFCEGSMRKHLERLGFTTVLNENRDFYKDLSSGPIDPARWKVGSSAPRPVGIPDFDVLVTNPPFSGDHIQRTLAFAAACGKPFMLLLPDFTARKAHYAEFLDKLTGGQSTAGSSATSGAIHAGAKRPRPSHQGDDEEEEEEEEEGLGAQDDSEDEDEDEEEGDEYAKARASTHGTVVRAVPSMQQTRREVPVLPSHMSYLGPAHKPYMFAAPGRDSDGDRPLIASGTATAYDPTRSRPFHVFAMTFQCVWFIHLGPTPGRHALLTSWWSKRYKEQAQTAAVLSDNMKDIPQLASDPNAKRKAQEKAKRPWRKKLMRQRKKQVVQGEGSGHGGSSGQGGRQRPGQHEEDDDEY